jgi:hypothetical protein
MRRRKYMKKLIVSTIVTTLALVACGEPEKSLTYFENHPEEIAVTLQKCATTPGTKNCENADMANANLASRKRSEERMRRAEEDKRKALGRL